MQVDRSELAIRRRIQDFRTLYKELSKDWQGGAKTNPVDYWTQLLVGVLERCVAKPDEAVEVTPYLDSAVHFIEWLGIQTIMHGGLVCHPQGFIIGTQDDYLCEMSPREHTQIGSFWLENAAISGMAGLTMDMDETANGPRRAFAWEVADIAKKFRAVHYPPAMHDAIDHSVFGFLMLLPGHLVVDYCLEEPVAGFGANISIRLEFEIGVTALLTLDLGGRAEHSRKCWEMVTNGTPPPYPRQEEADIGRGLTSPVLIHSEELEGSAEYMAMHEDIVGSRVVGTGFFAGQGPLPGAAEVDLELYLEKTLPRCDCGLLDGHQYLNDICHACGTACTCKPVEKIKIRNSSVSGEHVPYCDCHELRGKTMEGTKCLACLSICRVWTPERKK